MRAPRLSIGLGSFLVSLALVVAVGIGSAIAVIPNNGTYSACHTKATGEVRVINYPKVKCAKGERLIRWSQQGPAGPVGPKGDPGPAGASGSFTWGDIANKPAGFADGVDDLGVTGIRLMYRESGILTLPSDGSSSAFVDCPSGSAAVGGGFEGDDGIRVTQSYRADADTWGVFALNTLDNANQDFRAVVTCLEPIPSGALTIARKGAKAAKSAKQAKRGR